MKEHRDTAPTPTSLRREKRERELRPIVNAYWWNNKLVGEWCAWRVKRINEQNRIS